MCLFSFPKQKQFKTLVLAFHTDQDTLSRRLEVQVNVLDIGQQNHLFSSVTGSSTLEGTCQGVDQ